MPYLWAFFSIWGTWFTTLVATSIYADVSSDGNASALPWLVSILGITIAPILTVVVFTAIAAGQCWDALDRRQQRH